MRRGERIVEVPVVYRARTFEEGKKIGYQELVTAFPPCCGCGSISRRFGR